LTIIAKQVLTSLSLLQSQLYNLDSAQNEHKQTTV